MVNRSCPKFAIPAFTGLGPDTSRELGSFVAQETFRITPAREEFFFKDPGCSCCVTNPYRENLNSAAERIRDNHKVSFPLTGSRIRPHKIDRDSFPCGSCWSWTVTTRASPMHRLATYAQMTARYVSTNFTCDSWPEMKLTDRMKGFIRTGMPRQQSVMMIPDNAFAKAFGFINLPLFIRCVTTPKLVFVN